MEFSGLLYELRRFQDMVQVAHWIDVLQYNQFNRVANVFTIM